MSGIVADLEEILNWVEKSASDSINQVADFKGETCNCRENLGRVQERDSYASQIPRSQTIMISEEGLPVYEKKGTDAWSIILLLRKFVTSS